MGVREILGQPPGISRSEWPAGEGNVVWFDLTGTTLAPPELLDFLTADCPGITLDMLEDLTSPDDKPVERHFDDGTIGLASTFSVRPERRGRARQRGEPRPAGVLTIEPVELLAGQGWLATRWHPTRTLRGNRRIGTGPPEDPALLLPVLERAWSRYEGRTSGDLGVLIMRELALTYAPAHRAISAWLEDWELGIYIGDARFDREDLANLWGARALLRDWLEPLNLPGVKSDPDRAWLPGTNHRLVESLDNRIDRSLAGLDRLGNSLRSSFSLLHVQQTEESQRGNEALQRRIEIVAAAFLVPTLIVGFYGANTWVPGEREHWGFWVMVAALILLTGLTLTVLTLMHRRAAREDEREIEERKKMRVELFDDPDSG